MVPHVNRQAKPRLVSFWATEILGKRRPTVAVPSALLSPFSGAKQAARSKRIAPDLLDGISACYRDPMTLKARVKSGRLVVDEPTDLPEGTVVELLPLDPGDWLDEEDRAALHRALKDSDEDMKSGRLVDADAILRELRSR